MSKEKKVEEIGFDIFEHFRRNMLVLLASEDMSAKDLSVKLGFVESRLGNLLTKSKHVPTVIELSMIAMYFHVQMDDLIHNKIKIGWE